MWNRRIGYALAAAVVFGAVASHAAPGPQLLARIERGLDFYHLDTDLSKLTTADAAALHLILSTPEGYIRTRSKLKTVLRKVEARQ